MGKTLLPPETWPLDMSYRSIIDNIDVEFNRNYYINHYSDDENLHVGYWRDIDKSMLISLEIVKLTITAMIKISM